MKRLIAIDPTENSVRDNYKLLIGGIIPRPIAFVTTLAEDGTLNGAPYSFFNVVSVNPPMIAVAVQRYRGEPKDTARNAMHTKEFVVHIVDADNVIKINDTAASLPPHESEVEIAGLTEVASTHISVPGVQEAKVRMECVLERVVELGDGDSISSDLVIGKIVQFHVSEEIYEDGYIDPHAFGAVSRLAGVSYAKIGDTFDMKRPK